ncbi:MAG TPA: phytanoyl-CoA dioxygenase family protein [Thermoanaerobaculia bacterium]|nr:phytanoyl-CoA dioxygenase family protein [Thermoanaerobaculia bacterium]
MSVPTLPARPWFDAASLERELAASSLDSSEQAAVRSFRDLGFLVLHDVFEPELLDSVITETRPLFRPEVPDGMRSRIRVQDVWEECPSVRAMATEPRILTCLERLYGRRPIPFQTLDFQVGTEQHVHQDRMFFDTLPADFMCGVWVALEDVSARNGTLFYYPGSHRLPSWSPDELGLEPVNRASARDNDQDRRRIACERALVELIETAGLERFDLEAPRGTVLIWASGLAHGGGAILEPGATRWSQVTHYFFEGCLYYTPLYSNRFLGDLYLRDLRDVASGAPIEHRYQGLPVRGVDRNGFYKLQLEVDEANGEELVRAIDQTDLRAHRRILEDVLASPSYRLGRALTAPLRWLRSRRGRLV